jgi:hypothetical protein
MTRNYHVTPSPDGGWDAKAEGLNGQARITAPRPRRRPPPSATRATRVAGKSASTVPTEASATRTPCRRVAIRIRRRTRSTERESTPGALSTAGNDSPKAR